MERLGYTMAYNTIPMSPKFLFQLGQFWEEISMEQHEVKLFKAMMLCATFGMFRINKLLRKYPFMDCCLVLAKGLQ